jgi:hypothetical protein
MMAEVLETATAAAEFVAAMNYMAAISEAATAADYIYAEYLWNPIDDTQTANWGDINNEQTPGWTQVTDTQSPGWTAVGTTQTPGWANVDDTQAPNWQNINMNS